MDLSKLSDADLEAVASGDMSKASDSALAYIASGGKESYAPKSSVEPKTNMSDYDTFRAKFLASQAAPGYLPSTKFSKSTMGIASPADIDAVDQAKTKMKLQAIAALPWARPTVEGLGAVGGGLMAGTLGLPSGPGAVAAGAAGAGLGYSTAKAGMDTLEEWLGGTPQAEALAKRSITDRALGSVYDTALGSTMEVGGQVLAPVVGGALIGAKNLVTRSPVRNFNDVAKLLAARKMASAKTVHTPSLDNSLVSTRNPAVDVYAKNADEAASLQQAIPGSNFTRGMMSDDPSILAMEQGLLLKSPEAASAARPKALKDGMLVNNRDAIQNYMNSQLPQGSMDDFVKELDAQIAARGQNSLTEANRLAGGEKEVFSARMRALEQQKLAELKGEAARLYSQVDLDMPVAPGMTFGQWKDARSAALNDLRAANARAASGDASGVMPAQQRVKDLEAILKRAGEGQTDAFGAVSNRYVDPAQIAKLRDANNFYRETYVPTARQGQFGKNVATNGTGEFKIADEISAGKYLQTGDNGLASANDFNRAFAGNTEATNTLRDYAKRDLYDHITGNGTEAPDLQKAQKWIADRMPALKKLGMDAEFDGLTGALKAQEDVAAFGKAIKSDPNVVLDSLLAAEGADKVAQTALKLKLMVRGNTAAEAGLKKAMADKMLQTAESAQIIGGNRIMTNAKFDQFDKKFGAAMGSIYTKSELQALANVRKAVEVESRLGRGLSGVNGSPTRDSSDTILSIFGRLAPFLDWTGRAARAVTEVLARTKVQTIQDYMVRATFDPVVAKELQASLSKARYSKDIADILGKHINKVTAINASSSFRDNQN